MTELRYVRRFQEWAQASSITWSRLSFPRAAGGHTVAYRLTPAVPPRGVVVVCHGAGNDALFAFVGIFKALLTRGLEIFSFDLDGHGRNSTTRFSEEHAASAIDEAVKQSGVAERRLPLHLLGVSLGGSLALAALPRLSATSAVIVCAPLRVRLTARTFLREMRPGLLTTAWGQREHFGLTGLIPAVGPFRRSVYPLRLREDEPGAFGYVKVVNRTLASLELERTAADIQTPVLLVYGARDLIAPADHGALLKRLLPSSALLTPQDETHLTLPLADATTRSALAWYEAHEQSRNGAVDAEDRTHGVARR